MSDLVRETWDAQAALKHLQEWVEQRKREPSIREPIERGVTLEAVYNRDGGICQICGKKIQFAGSVWGEEYPTVDHVVPLSRGGGHTWENVRLACRSCNMIKSDKTDEEMTVLYGGLRCRVISSM